MGIEGQRKSTSARGEQVDFDLLLIKQQLAAAPQNIEVARRQEFIDNKEEGKTVRKKTVTVEANQPLPPLTPVTSQTSTDFENENGDVPAGTKAEIIPVPVIERKPKK